MLRTQILTLFWGCLCFGRKLPDYIKPCHLTEPNLSECLEKRANEILPTLTTEDKTFNLPSLSPFAIKLIVPSGNIFKFELQGTAQGLEGSRIQNSSFNTETLTEIGVLYIPKIVVTGSYEIEGKYLLKKVSKTGLATVTFDGVFFRFNWPYTLSKKNGIDHLKTLNVTYTYEIQHSNIVDKNNEFEINTLLGENWKLIAKYVEPSLMKTIYNLFIETINAVTNYSSFNEIFLP